MGEGPHGDVLYDSWCPLASLINLFSKVLGIPKDLFQKVLRPPEARSLYYLTSMMDSSHIAGAS